MRLLLMVFIFALSCSTKNINYRTNSFTDNWIMRGQAEMLVKSSPGLRSYSASQEVTQQVIGTVAESVKFNVSNANFIIPATLENEVSYGSLDLTNVFDNKLRVCGASGKDKCTAALLRIFTRGGGEGFWNAAEGYGAPIKTNAKVIGLETAGAYVIKTIPIPANKFVIKMSDFNASGKPLPIPVTINFSNAPAGSYSTVLVIQYALQ